MQLFDIVDMLLPVNYMNHSNFKLFFYSLTWTHPSIPPKKLPSKCFLWIYYMLHMCDSAYLNIWILNYL